MIALVAAAASEEVFQLAAELGGPGRVVLLVPQPPAGRSLGTAIVDVDLLSAVATSEAWRRLEERHGTVDELIVVTAPTPTGTTRVADISDALWSSTMEELTTAMHAARAAAPLMLSRRRGRITFVTWCADDPQGRVPFVTVSGAINQLARALATELGAAGVTVNAVSAAPGRLASVAPLIRFLGSEESGYVTAEVVSLAGTNVGGP